LQCLAARNTCDTEVDLFCESLRAPANAVFGAALLRFYVADAALLATATLTSLRTRGDSVPTRTVQYRLAYSLES
jgi:hypothetical protein